MGSDHTRNNRVSEATSEALRDTYLIQAKNLGKRVNAPDGGSLDILNGVDFQVKPGEAVAILGASGSGKSTLLGLLAGLDQPTQGDVILLGESLRDLDEDARARLRLGQVGFVFQSFQLLPGMSALENVMLPLQLRKQLDAAAQAQQLLQQVGLAKRIAHRPTELSGGEQQRVAIARAFAGKPRLLFADEPTGNLDSDTGHMIEDLLFDLRDRFNTALVLVTHEQGLAQRCDRIVQLQGGRVR